MLGARCMIWHMSSLSIVLLIPLTKKSVSPTLLISTVQTGILREVDTHPPFRSTVQHKAFITEYIDVDVEATQDHWGHLVCYPVYHRIQKDTMVSAPISEMGGKIPPCEQGIPNGKMLHFSDRSGWHENYQYNL